MDRNGAAERVRGSNVTGDGRPLGARRALVFEQPLRGRFGGGHPGAVQVAPQLRRVERHERLAGDAPDHRVGAVAGDQGAPVPAQHLGAGELHEVAPGADDGRHHAQLDHVLDPPVGGVEPGGIQRREVPAPGKAGLVGAARVERRHVRVESGDQQRHGEALAGPVGGQPLEVLRPAQTPHQAHPPGVGQPQERRPVRVLQVPGAGRNAAERPVPVERVVLIGSRLDLDDAGAAVQRRVARVRAAGDEPVPAHRRRGIAHAPPPRAGFERRHGQLPAFGIGDQDVQLDPGRVGVRAAGGVLPRAHPVPRGMEELVHVSGARVRRPGHRPGAA